MKKYALSITAAAALISLNAHAGSVEFKNIYSLGDSLSDVGVYSNAVIGGAALQNITLPNIQYRFTNNNLDGSSKVWVEDLAGRLGLTIRPNRINPTEVGGTAFAEGGARVSNPVGIGYAPGNLITTVPLTTQVDRLLAQKPKLDASDLVFLWAGANDGFTQLGLIGAGAATPTEGLTQMAMEGGAMATQVQRLRTAGAKYVVVALVPNLANTPFGALLTSQSAAAGQLLTGLSSTFNMQVLSSVPAAGAVVVDVNKLLGDVIANPVKYGFNANSLGATACGVNPAATGPNDYFNSSLTSCFNSNPQNYLFADGVHPSAKAHAMFGQFAYSGLQAIAQSAALMVAPMVAIRQHGQSLESRLNIGALVDSEGKLRPEKDVQFYASPEVGRFSTAGGQIEPSVKADTIKTAFGLDTMVAKNALVGLAMSYSQGDSQFGGQSGSLKTKEMMGVLYTTVALSPNWYVNASAGMGNIDHSQFTRQLVLPTTTISATSSPQGSYKSLRVGAGWIGDWLGGKGGPYTSITDEKVSIDGFTETDSPMSLSFGDMAYKAQRLTLGAAWTQTRPVGQWRMFARAALDRDLKSTDLVVRMGPNPLALADVAVPRPERTTWNATLGFALPQSDTGVWSLQMGLGGPKNKLEAKTLGFAYRKGF